MATWVPQPSAFGRTLSEERSTAALAAGAEAMLRFETIGRAGLLLSVTASHPAWFTLYATAEQRSADGSRALTEDPALDAGVLVDVLLEAGRELPLNGVIYLNNESPQQPLIYGRLRRQGGAGSEALTVTLKALVLAP